MKPSSTSGWDFTPMEQRQWIDIETQESNAPYCFQMSKFITRILRYSQEDRFPVLELCDMEIHQKISMLNYQKLKTMVKRSIDQELRLRNFDARHGRIESGAVVENRKGLIGAEGGKGTCYQLSTTVRTR